MKLAKKMALFVMIAGGLTIIATPLLEPKASAANVSVDGGGSSYNFVNGSGASDYVAPANNTRFIFQDPFNIIDTQAKDSDGNPIVYTTKSTACGNDNMYVCADGNTFHTGSYWYWPNGTTFGDKDGTCESALVLHIRMTPGGTGLNNSKLFVVNAHKGVQGSGCYVQDTSGKTIARKDIEGWGAKAIDDNDADGNSADTIVNKNDVVELDKFDNSDKKMFYALATEFAWKGPNEIDSIMHGRQLIKATDPSTVSTISNDLKNGFNEVKQYGGGYDYYYNKECVNNKNQILALLVVKQGNPSEITIIHRNGGSGSKGFRADTWVGDQQSCLIGENHTTSPARMWGGSRGDVTLGMADITNYVTPGSAEGTGATAGSSDQGSNDTTSCESTGGVLAWIMCPVYNYTASATQWMLEHLIVPMLKVNPICADSSSCSSSDNTIYAVWSNFRTYGDIFLVIALLVVVFGEALGGGMIDAYTAKKILPRLLAAAILINLSIYIVAFLVDVFNVLGGGIWDVITAPVAKAGGLVMNLGGNGTQTIIGLSTGGAVLIAGTVIAMSSIGVLLLVLGLVVTGLLAILGVFITLVIRQAIITALVFVAPVAFALWCLPNTEKWFKKWWDTLFQMLLAYPLILGLFAVANVMAAIVGQDQSTLNAIISFALVLIPLFMVPAMLKMSGSMLGQIQGAMSGMMKRANSFTGRKLIGAGGKEIASRAHEAAQGNFFKGGNKGNRRGKFNERFHYAATAANLRNLNGPPSRWKGAVRSAMSTQSLEDMAKMTEDTDYKQWMNDDTINRAAAESNDAASFQARLRALDKDGRFSDQNTMDAITAHVDRVRRKYDADTFRRTTTLQAIAGGTAYDAGEFAEALAKAAGNDDAMLGTLVGQARGLAMKSGRIEQGAASYGKVVEAAAGIRNKLRAGTLTQADIHDAGEAIEDSAADSSSPGQAIYGKPQSAKALAEAHSRKIREIAYSAATGMPDSTGQVRTERDLKQAMASAAGIYDAMAQASPQNARAFADGLNSNTIDIRHLPDGVRASMALRPDGQSSAAGNISMLEGFENLRAHDRQFAEMRRDYGSQAAAEAAHAAGITGTPPVPGGPPPGSPPTGPPGTI